MNKLLFTIILILYSSVSVLANPSVQARTGILMDFHSDEILFELEPDQQIYPASMTKIMTAIVAFDLIKKNKLSLDDKFIISDNASTDGTELIGREYAERDSRVQYFRHDEERDASISLWRVVTLDLRQD